MNRYGLILLLVSLTGCISFTTTQPQTEKKSGDMPANANSLISPSQTCTAASMSAATNLPPTITAPSNATWMAHPEHQIGSNYGVSRPSSPPTVPTQSLTPWVTTPRPSSPVSSQPTPKATAPATPPTSTASAYPAFPTMLPSQSPSPTPVAMPVVPSTPVPNAPVVPPVPPRTTLQTVTLPATTVPTPKVESPAERLVSHTVTTPSSEQTASASTSKPSEESVSPIISTIKRDSKPLSENRSARSGTPLIRLVNSKRITLNFEVKDVGPSGLSCVELWYTQDGREWKKHEVPTQTQSYVIEVDGEGMYGFTLLGRNGVGLSKNPPAPGDQPQMWVVVDLSKPDLRLLETSPQLSSKTPQMTIRWKATDKNFGRQPISLSYAEKEEGPWKPIASNLENTGKYNWQMPSGLARVLIRVEATDLAGNSSSVQSSKPILLDDKLPTVSILGVEPNPSK